jgi:hypothetical protein
VKTSEVVEVVVVIVIIVASIGQKDTQDEIGGGGGGRRMQIDVVEGADKEINPLPLLEDDGASLGDGVKGLWPCSPRATDIDPKSCMIIPSSSSTKAKKRSDTPSTFRGSTTHIVKTRHVPEKGTSSTSAAAEMELAGDVMIFFMSAYFV